MGFTEINRIGDESYLIKHGQEQFIVTVPKEVGSPEYCYTLLSRFMQQGLPPEPPKEVRIGSRQWSLLPVDVRQEEGLIQRVGTLLNRFFFPPSDEGIKKYRLQEVSPSFLSQLFEAPGRSKQEEELLSMATLLDSGLTLDEVRSGIKKKSSFTTVDDDLASKPFQDPFTELATHSFQRYEPHFADRDFAKPTDCNTFLVYKNNELLLVEKKEGITFKHEATVSLYYERLKALYGEEKVHYLEHLFHINFEEMMENNTPLTPEIVFRMNVGATLKESQEMGETVKRLRTLLKNLKADTPDPQAPLDVEALKDILLGDEQRALHQHFQTVGELKEWLEALHLNEKPFHEMPSKQVTALMKVFTLSKEDRARALTGRAIFEPIKGWYNSNQHEEYKPWVDQQQLLQAIGDYEGTKDWMAFYEKLSFVIVKMQLVREHPTEGYRVGMLLPAPLDEAGNQRWYRVSSVVSNGYGLFSYTLEGVGHDTALPAIKLYQSTQSSSYCMHGKASLRSDLNPLNSPGYLGRGLADRYETAFFDARSIPVWVGYLLQAEKLLEEGQDRKAHDALKRAQAELQQQTEKPFRQKNLKELIRAHDAILVDLLTRQETLSGDAGADFLELIVDLQERYVKGKKRQSKEIQKQDAKRLQEAVNVLDRLPLKPHQHRACKKLSDDLSIHLLGQQKTLNQERAKALRHLREDGFDGWVAQSDAKEELTRWARDLRTYAKAHGETPEQKTQQPLVLAGHSLGGAAADLHLHHFLFDRGRIPLPGMGVSLYSMDDPGGNHEVNEAYKKFGNSHSQLFDALNIKKVEIYRAHEAGDPVAFGGGEHLGATSSPKEEEEVSKWQIYHGTVLERYETAKSRQIASSKTAHGTQFRLGKKQKAKGVAHVTHTDADYLETEIPSLIQGMVDKGGKLKKIEAETVAESFRKDLWKIDLFNLRSVEALRTGATGLAALALLAPSEAHPRGEQYFDEDGIFAVDERGIQSHIKPKA